MSITIDFDPEIEDRLREVAAERGQDAVTFARTAVEDKLKDMNRVVSTGKPLTELLKDVIGSVQSQNGKGQSRLAEQTGADIAADWDQKHRLSNQITRLVCHVQ